MEHELCSCCESELKETSLSFSLHEILKKWEVNGVSISSETWAEYSQDKSLTLFACERCGFSIYNPPLVGTENFYKDITASDYYLDDRWDFHIALDLASKKYLKSILDIGCGRGAFISNAQRRDKSLSLAGLDKNPSTKESFPDFAKLYSSFTDIDKTYDLVTLFQVVEHVENPFQLLQDSFNKVSPKGYLIVSVPDYSGPIRFFPDSHTAIPPHHISQWTPESLKNSVQRLGAKLVSIETETLPDYLYDSYLPAIISHRLSYFFPRRLSARLANKLAMLAIRVLALFNIKSLPLHGHTCLVIAQKD